MAFSFIPVRRSPASWPTTSASSSTIWRATLKHEHRAFTGECHPSLDVRRDRRGGRNRRRRRRRAAGGAARALSRRRAARRRREGAAADAPRNRRFTWSSASSAASRAPSALNGAFDIAAAPRDRRCDGELTIVLPKLSDRRGQSHRIRSTAAARRSHAMKILFIGDIVGKPGRELVRKGLRRARRALRASIS